MKFEKLRMFLWLLTCLAILMVVVENNDHKLFGHSFEKASVKNDPSSAITVENDCLVVNTTSIGKDIMGFGGDIPMLISIKDEKIVAISPLENTETPEFFNRVAEGLIPKWIGVSVKDVAANNVDALSGATFSSNAVNETIKRGVSYYAANTMPEQKTNAAANGPDLSLKTILAFVTVLCAALIPLFIKNKYYRYIQLISNVVVLGFWTGTFLSYELFMSYVANGIHGWNSMAVILMLVVAFVYPYFGKKSHYCSWVCPLGSVQGLAGKCVKFKIRMPAKLVKGLNIFQECLWFALMILMVAGIWTDWAGYELFKAFIFESASWSVIIAAIVVVVLSLIIPRPYCRFVCPTGYMLRLTQGTERPLKNLKPTKNK